MELHTVAELLLDWYGRAARDLPWRRISDPYGILVSEVMLQQTQVRTVIPYWTAWMKAFPTLQDLSAASIDEVLKHWSGLGYYSRAKNLHRAARMIVDTHSGQFPRAYEDILQLPGIGRYTAGAICSIAFGEAKPVLDGNVIRVLTRLYALDGDPGGQECRSLLWTLAERLVSAASHLRPLAGGCGDFNQALMELGATVCHPRAPACAECPLLSLCAAQRAGQQESFPKSQPRSATVRRHVFAFIALRQATVLVRKNGEKEVNGGLWEFPSVEVSSFRARVARAAKKCLGHDPLEPRHFMDLSHTIMRYRIKLRAFLAEVPSAYHSLPNTRWVRITDLPEMALPSAHRRLTVELLRLNSTGEMNSVNSQGKAPARRKRASTHTEIQAETRPPSTQKD
jgi:A/G-specific adenine glycosylase